MAPEGDRVAVEGIASAGLRPLVTTNSPSCGPNADRSMASRSLSTEIAGVSEVMSSWRRSVPHDEQKLDPIWFSSPQLGQMIPGMISRR